MREEFEEFLETVNTETTIDELVEYCQTDEEWELIFKKVRQKRLKTHPDFIPLEWQERSWEVFKDVPVCQIKTKDIQIKMQVGYHLAIKIKDWLVHIKKTGLVTENLNLEIARILCDGLREYVFDNNNAALPQNGPDATAYGKSSATLLKMRKEWHARIEKLATEFESLANSDDPYHFESADLSAFDELKEIYKDLYIVVY